MKAEARCCRSLLLIARPDLGAFHARERTRLDRRVAVAAIDAESRDVVLVAELDRLRSNDADLRRVRGPEDEPNESADASENEHRAKNAGAGNGVHAGMKDLGHRSDANVLSISVQVGLAGGLLAEVL